MKFVVALRLFVRSFVAVCVVAIVLRRCVALHCVFVVVLWSRCRDAVFVVDWSSFCRRGHGVATSLCCYVTVCRRCGVVVPSLLRVLMQTDILSLHRTTSYAAADLGLCAPPLSCPGCLEMTVVTKIVAAGSAISLDGLKKTAWLWRVNCAWPCFFLSTCCLFVTYSIKTAPNQRRIERVQCHDWSKPLWLPLCQRQQCPAYPQD